MCVSRRSGEYRSIAASRCRRDSRNRPSQNEVTPRTYSPSTMSTGSSSRSPAASNATPASLASASSSRRMEFMAIPRRIGGLTARPSLTQRSRARE